MCCGSGHVPRPEDAETEVHSGILAHTRSVARARARVRVRVRVRVSEWPGYGYGPRWGFGSG